MGHILGLSYGDDPNSAGYLSGGTGAIWAGAAAKGKVNQLTSLTTSDPTLNAYLAAAADPKNPLHNLLTAAVSTADKWKLNSIWEEGVVTVLDPTANSIVGSLAVQGRGPGSAISEADVLSAVKSLDPSGGLQAVFYHDHTDYGGTRPLSDADIRVGWRDNTITLARSGDQIFVMRPTGGGSSPSLKLYSLPTSLLGF